MDERFRVVVRWASLILLGVAAGGLASWVGVATLAMLAGAVVAFGCGVFVFASVWATYLPSRRGNGDDLAGPGLFRAVDFAFFGAGVIVGAVTFGGVIASAIAATSGLVALLLTRDSGSSTGS
jgi:hypothetical protein